LSDSWIPNVNGVVVSVQNEIRVLFERGYEITLFVPKTKKAPNSEVDLPLANIVEHRSIPFPGYQGYNIALPDLKLRAEIKKKRFDLIHCQTPFSLWVMARILRRTMQIPMVSTFHTWISEYSGHFLGGHFKNQTKAFLEPVAWTITRFNNFSNAVIAPSESLKNELLTHGVTRAPICVAPSPISSFFFEKKPDVALKKSARNKIKKKHAIDPDNLLLMYIGRVSFEKRLDLLLKAYKSLKAKIADSVYLLIAGDGPHIDAYKKQAVNLGLTQEEIGFTGWIPHKQLPPYYAAADVFVSPSDTETQGLTFVEAMSQATPVIGVKAGGVQNLIENKRNGFLVPPNDIDSIEKSLRILIANKEMRIEMGKKGLQTAQAYTLDKFGENLPKVFEIAQENYNERTGRK
ncbi:MAG: glycosyltransferase, partial [Candidatus Hermodarchaeota archaeon]